MSMFTAGTLCLFVCSHLYLTESVYRIPHLLDITSLRHDHKLYILNNKNTLMTLCVLYSKWKSSAFFFIELLIVHFCLPHFRLLATYTLFWSWPLPILSALFLTSSVIFQLPSKCSCQYIDETDSPENLPIQRSTQSHFWNSIFPVKTIK